MNDAHGVMAVEADIPTMNALILRYCVGFLRGLTFTALLVTYLLWASGGFALLPPGNWRFTDILLFLVFLVSFPAFGYLCTVQDQNKDFATATIPMMTTFMFYSPLIVVVLTLGSSTFNDGFTMSKMAAAAGFTSPVLAIALTMILIIITRLGTVWEPPPKRPKVLKSWLYLAPASFLLICQGFSIFN